MGSGGVTKSLSSYPILNVTNYNAIKWTGGKNGFYFFSARVMDPAQRYSIFQINNSYCTLTANFAVEVYGAPLAPEYQAAIVAGIMVVVIGLLTVSYYVQRSKMITKHKKE